MATVCFLRRLWGRGTSVHARVGPCVQAALVIVLTRLGHVPVTSPADTAAQGLGYPSAPHKEMLHYE